MATSDPTAGLTRWAQTGDRLLAGRPLVALVAVLLTTGGHTMNLREMGVSQGWVAAEVYALQSSYLVSLALTMLACPGLSRRWTCRGLTQAGLILAIAGPLLNMLETGEPLPVSLIGRVMAGAGAGMVIYFAPRLLDPHWAAPVAWAFILCPVAGPGVVSVATMLYESSDWRYGFLFEGIAAAVGLGMLLSMPETPESPPQTPRGSLAYLPSLVVGTAALFYALHWGQLHGWLESEDIVVAATTCVCALSVALGLAWPHLDWPMVTENRARLALFFFGGMCQFFHGYIMNIYGGTIVNLSSWQRAWLIWPLPIGIALALALSRRHWRFGRMILDRPGILLGLMFLAMGLYLCYLQTMEWPYWDVRDVVDLNWFPAPGPWELAPGRFLMGLGIGLFMAAAETQISHDSERAERVRPFLNVVQFSGGGIAAALLINCLIIGHKIHYSYAADRDMIQAEELTERENLLSNLLHQAGQTAPDRSAEVLLYRFVNYEADNLVFATIYAIFLLATIALAGLFISLSIYRRLRPVSDTT